MAQGTGERVTGVQKGVQKGRADLGRVEKRWRALRLQISRLHGRGQGAPRQRTSRGEAARQRSSRAEGSAAAAAAVPRRRVHLQSDARAGRGLGGGAGGSGASEPASDDAEHLLVDRAVPGVAVDLPGGVDGCGRGRSSGGDGMGRMLTTVAGGCRERQQELQTGHRGGSIGWVQRQDLVRGNGRTLEQAWPCAPIACTHTAPPLLPTLPPCCSGLLIPAACGSHGWLGRSIQSPKWSCRSARGRCPGRT